jgi:sugar/nucleoside kinase (ribokinase family)
MTHAQTTLRTDLVAVGDVMVDVVAPAPVRPVQHAPVEIRAGGSAVNAARAAVSLGRRAIVVGCVGDDGLADLVRRELADARIEARLGVDPGLRTGRVVVVGDAIVAERGANAGFVPEHVGELDGAVVLISGYQLFREDSGAGAEAGLDADAVVGLDLGSAHLVRSFGVERARELARRADVVIGNDDAVEALGDPGGVLLVETLGAAGARAEGTTVEPPRVLEQTLFGAGDAFAAAFLLSLSDGLPLADCLAAGCGTAVDLAAG